MIQRFVLLSVVYYSILLFSHEESTTPLTEESTTPLKESNSLKKGVTPRYVSNYESNYESNVVVHHSTPSTSAMTATQTTKSAQHGAQIFRCSRSIAATFAPMRASRRICCCPLLAAASVGATDVDVLASDRAALVTVSVKESIDYCIVCIL
jgi:hypothetical protein